MGNSLTKPACQFWIEKSRFRAGTFNAISAPRTATIPIGSANYDQYAFGEATPLVEDDTANLVVA